MVFGDVLWLITFHETNNNKIFENTRWNNINEAITLLDYDWRLTVIKSMHVSFQTYVWCMHNFCDRQKHQQKCIYSATDNFPYRMNHRLVSSSHAKCGNVIQMLRFDKFRVCGGRRKDLQGHSLHAKQSKHKTHTKQENKKSLRMWLQDKWQLRWLSDRTRTKCLFFLIHVHQLFRVRFVNVFTFHSQFSRNFIRFR